MTTANFTGNEPVFADINPLFPRGTNPLAQRGTQPTRKLNTK
jgi:hypothetical protein